MRFTGAGRQQNFAIAAIARPRNSETSPRWSAAGSYMSAILAKLMKTGQSMFGHSSLRDRGAEVSDAVSLGFSAKFDIR
ncbi:MAG: hypothetical protein E5W44_16500 [Mesorhizobium sp.]|nr:MAG: hypothetical protein E5W44_16500 [Mesorhizobium sp.]